MTLAELKSLARKTFGRFAHHALGTLTDAETGAAVRRAGDLKSGMTLRVHYRESHGCPQPLHVLNGGHRRGRFGGGGGGGGGDRDCAVM